MGVRLLKEHTPYRGKEMIKMKKTLLAMAMATSVAMVPAVQAYELKTEDQKLSYSLGLVIAEKLKLDMNELDLEAFQEGVKAIYKDTTPLLTDEQVGATMQAFQMKRMEEQQRLVAELAQANLEKGQAYLAENGKKSGVKTTESGLQYEELVAGKEAA